MNEGYIILYRIFLTPNSTLNTLRPKSTSLNYFDTLLQDDPTVASAF